MLAIAELGYFSGCGLWLEEIRRRHVDQMRILDVVLQIAMHGLTATIALTDRAAVLLNDRT